MSVVQKFRLRLYKLLAISQKNILLDTRFKGQVIVSYITPIISIIISNFNGEKFLKRCLHSILAEGEKPFEIIVVEDGSTMLKIM